MIWFLTHPPPPPRHVSKLSLVLSLPVSLILLTDGSGLGGWGGGADKSYDGLENLILYKSFNTLWSRLLTSFSKLIPVLDARIIWDVWRKGELSHPWLHNSGKADDSDIWLEEWPEYSHLLLVERRMMILIFDLKNGRFFSSLIGGQAYGSHLWLVERWRVRGRELYSQFANIRGKQEQLALLQQRLGFNQLLPWISRRMMQSTPFMLTQSVYYAHAKIFD